MKRIFVFLLLILTVLLTTIGCAKASKSTDEHTTKENENKNSEFTDKEDTKPNNGQGSHGEIATLPLESYEDYLKFIQTAELPDDFVRYETFSQFGEFESMVCAPSYGYSEYSYSIIDNETGMKLRMYIDHGKELTLDGQDEPAKVNKNDMRTIPKDSARIFVQSGIQYIYVQGNLSAVKWVSNGIMYTISGDLHECKLDSSSPLSKLLKLDTAAEAVASVKEPSEAIK